MIGTPQRSMRRTPANFDRLAGIYRTLELIAFGRDLERARFRFLDRLCECRSILVLGEGDGRALARLRQAAPLARIHCIDASAAMLARCAARLPDRSRVVLEQADLLDVSLPPGDYDAVVTFFVLDCFRPEQVDMIVAAVRRSLRPGALWLFADFVMPVGRLARWRAAAWLGILYAFFRWQTGLHATHLPESEEILRRHGFAPMAACDFQRGLIRSAVFVRAGPARCR
jgi:SAM-dependent methyltransferase